MSKPVDGALSGKVALVTQAYTGVGRSIAKALAAQGARVVIHHPHIPEAAADVLEEITSAGGDAVGLAADIGDRTEYEELVQALLEDCGRWDVLVTTATVPDAEPFAQISGESFDSFVVAVRGVFHGLQLALRHLADGGRIITVCDAVSPNGAIYGATLGAVERLGRAVSADFATRQITVNAVGRGITEAADPELAAGVAALRQPAEVVTYLVGEAGKTVTGQVVRLDGAAEPVQ
ncbi:SDR family NAD(P)-dependent oxidoreductase [Nocardia sp. NPDC049190]|uniref:SDR family NAD(P)-dependent oxidoreductase n=1 Tax=Nocardia sp. NPDC049190 TaxID=3155650 RepID=UPI0033E6E4DB